MMLWLIESMGCNNVSRILILVDGVVVSLLLKATTTSSHVFQFLWDFLASLSEKLDKSVSQTELLLGNERVSNSTCTSSASSSDSVNVVFDGVWHVKVYNN